METLNEIKEVIILAAGRSRRMEQLSKRQPKCLLPYKGEKVLARVVRQIKENGIHKIVITAGYKANAISEIFKDDPDVTIVENNMYEEDVNIYSMKLALAKIAGPCVVFEADTIMEDGLVKYILGSDFEGKSVWFTRGRFTEIQYGGILRSDKFGKVTDIRIVASYQEKYKNYLKLTGLMRISADELELFRALVNRYASTTIKQYYFNPWIENLKLLPCYEADISPFAFYTFNKPQEYYQVATMNIGVMQPAPPVEYVDISTLHSIEAFNEDRVRKLMDKLLQEGVWTVPVIVEEKHRMVLDGQHRLESAKRLGLQRIPVVFVDYDDVQVWTLRKEEKVSQKLVKRRVIDRNDIYPYKTVKHKFNFAVPTLEEVALDTLKAIK
jgi:choline kinase